MKVGIVTTWFERGAAYVSKQLLNTLSLEHDVYIYARGGEEFAINDNEWNREYVTWGKKVDFPIPTFIDILDFSKWLKENSIEAVIFNEQWWWEPIVFCNNSNIKVGAYVDYYTEETLHFFECYDFLICNTKKHFEAFKWHKQAYYIPWGTDISLFKPISYDIVHSDKITFFHSCGMSPDRKGTDLLIEAACEIKQDFLLRIHTQIDLTKKLSVEVAQKLSELVANRKVEILEKTIKAPGAYFMGDIYVYPTRLEGIGLTICEAISSGLPSIVPNNSPMNEFVNKETGLVIDIEKLFARYDGYYWPQCEVNIEALVENMEFYINNLHSLKKYKKDAREYAEKNFDWNKNSKILNQLIEESKILSKDKKIQKNALTFYDKKFYNISRYQLLFKLLYKLFKAIRK